MSKCQPKCKSFINAVAKLGSYQIRHEYHDKGCWYDADPSPFVKRDYVFEMDNQYGQNDMSRIRPLLKELGAVNIIGGNRKNSRGFKWLECSFDLSEKKQKYWEEQDRIADQKLAEEMARLHEQRKVKFVGKTFVFTGKGKYTRNRMIMEVEKRGGTVANTVNKNTTYLVDSDRNKITSKLQKAKELGVEVLSDVDFWILCDYFEM